MTQSTGQKQFGLKVGQDGFLIQICENHKPLLALAAPEFEISGQPIMAQGWTQSAPPNSRAMRNGGLEESYIFNHTDDPSLELTVLVRSFEGSPFVRFCYQLSAKELRTMTKSSGSDAICYTNFSLPNETQLTEVQVSQFESIVHSFLPSFQPLRQEAICAGTQFSGPIALWQHEDVSGLIAYEHGAEYPDSYLRFSAQSHESGAVNLRLSASKGNYCHLQRLDSEAGFRSPWFHAASLIGNEKTLLDEYRRFFLEQISESNASRQPLIFYNTWNKQERSKYYRSRPYLDTMHLQHTLEEIDIAAKLGVDVFVIDTGWYNKTGDWLVNLERFPDNLASVKEKLDSYGMQLGLWFNPIVAARTSKIMLEHPEYRMNKNGVDNDWGSIWETEESWGMCLVSGYTDHFIRKMIELNRELGVTYFKWDAIGQYGCDASWHNHGTEDNTAQERLEQYSFQMGLEMIRIVEEVSKACPDIIVDFDVTEGGRFVGLGFLSVGKYFLMNNGPYFSSFDIPAEHQRIPETINVFFHPGAARCRVCRQGTRFDSFIPSVLFLTHFLPDAPAKAQRNSLASLVLGGNGLWGDLMELSEADVDLIQSTITAYKKVAQDVTRSVPRTTGFIGSSPEIHEKIDYETGRGLISFFTRSPGSFTTVTLPVKGGSGNQVTGADHWEKLDNGSLRITVKLEKDDARVVFISS